LALINTRWETAKELGLEFDIAPKLSVEDGIEQVRRMLPKCYFHKNNCNKLVEALKSYCKRWDEKIIALEINLYTIGHHTFAIQFGMVQ